MSDIPIIGKDKTEEKKAASDISDNALLSVAVEEFILATISQGLIEGRQLLFSGDGIAFVYERYGVQMFVPLLPFEGAMDELSLPILQERYVKMKDTFFPSIGSVVDSLIKNEDLDEEGRAKVVAARDKARTEILKTEVGRIMQNRMILLSFLLEEEDPN